MPVYLPSQVEIIDKIKDRDDAAAGQGVQSSYLSSNDIELDAAADTVTIDTANLSSSAHHFKPSVVTTKKFTNVNLQKANYIHNDEGNSYGNKADSYTPPAGSGKSSGLGQTGGVGSSSQTGKTDSTNGVDYNNVVDALNKADVDFDEMLNNLRAEDYYTENEDGFWVPDPQKLEQLFNKAMQYVFLMGLYISILESSFRQKKMAAQLMLELHLNRASLGELNENIQTKVSFLTGFMNEVYNAAIEHNQAVYETMLKEAEKNCDGFWEQVGDFFSGGEYSKDVLEDRIEAGKKFKAATTDWLNIMKNVLGGENLFGITINVNFDNVVVTRENGYLAVDTQKVVALREEIANQIAKVELKWENIYRSIERYYIPLQILLELKAGKANHDVTSTVARTASSHILSVFDHTSNLVMMNVQIHNQINYTEKQLEKMSGWYQVANVLANYATLAAIIISLVLTVYTGGAASVLLVASIALAAGAAALKFVSSAIADALVHDDYTPLAQEMKKATEKSYEASRDEMMNLLVDLEKKENELLKKAVNNNFTKLMSDGMMKIDFSAFSKFQAELDQNLQLQQFIRESVMRNIERIFIPAQMLLGIGKGSGGLKRIIGDICAVSDQMTGLELTTAKLYAQELKAAHNLERQQEVALESAAVNMAFSVGFSVVGGFVGAASGVAGAFAVGWSLGSAVGNALGEYYNAALAPWSSAGLDLNADQAYLSEILDNMIDEAGDEEEKVFLELEKGLLTDGLYKTGENRYGVDAYLLTKVNRMIGDYAKLQTIKENAAIAPLQQLYQVASTLLEIDLGGDFSEIKQIRQSKVQSKFKRLGYITSFLREKAEVKNRAAQAEENVSKALTNFVVNVAVAVVGTAAAALSSTLSVLTLATSLMGIVTGAYNVAFYKDVSESGLGDLSDYSKEKIRQQMGIDEKKGNYYSKYDQLEDELYLQLTQSLLSYFGLNQGFNSLYSVQAKRVSRGKEMILKGQTYIYKALKRVLVALFGTSAADDIMEEILGIDANVISSTVNNYLAALQDISQREMEQDQARSMMWSSVVQLSIKVVMTVLSSVKLYYSELNAKSDSLGKAAQKDGKLTKAEYEANKVRVEFLSKVSMFLSVLTSMSDYFTNLIYRALRDDEDKNPEQQKEEKTEPGKKVMGVMDSRDRLERETVNSGIVLGSAMLDRERIMDTSQLNKVLYRDTRKELENSASLGGDYVKEHIEDKKKVPSVAKDAQEVSLEGFKKLGSKKYPGAVTEALIAAGFITKEGKLLPKFTENKQLQQGIISALQEQGYVDQDGKITDKFTADWESFGQNFKPKNEQVAATKKITYEFLKAIWQPKAPDMATKKDETQPKSFGPVDVAQSKQKQDKEQKVQQKKASAKLAAADSQKRKKAPEQSALAASGLKVKHFESLSAQADRIAADKRKVMKQVSSSFKASNWLA